MKRFSIILFIILSSSGLNGQNLLTNNNALITISEVPFIIQGDASNTGSILNEGDLRLSGNWANRGDYSSVSGTFLLNGDNQIFEPGESRYSHLSVNSSGVAVLSDLEISQLLQLKLGLLSLSSGSSIFLGSSAIITDANEDSYVDGALFSSSQGDFTFPVGTENEYLPVSISSIQSTEPIGIQAFSSSINSSISKELDAISTNRYWQILENSTFSAKAITLPMINETFIENVEEAAIAFTNILTDPLKVWGVPFITGSVSSGSILSQANIISGYYTLADLSVGGPPIKVINVVTALQDGKHDFLRIDNIEFYEGNKVELFNRTGTKVFEMDGYNNADKVFRGISNVGNSESLPTGSYYFTVQLGGKKRESGFIYLKN